MGPFLFPSKVFRKNSIPNYGTSCLSSIFLPKQILTDRKCIKYTLSIPSIFYIWANQIQMFAYAS